MQMERLEGMAIVTGSVVDQAQLIGLIQPLQGLELVSVEQASAEVTDSGPKVRLNVAATRDRALLVREMQPLPKGTDDIRQRHSCRSVHRGLLRP
jgi:hypothetical protein